MKILFDNGTPRPVAHFPTGHEVTYVRRIGWHELESGELIQQAEQAGYTVLLRTDKNIRYQQNLSGRKIALVILGNPQWPAVRLQLDRVAAAVSAATPGSHTEVDIPIEVTPHALFLGVRSAAQIFKPLSRRVPRTVINRRQSRG